MYDDIIHLAMDQQLLTEIRERDTVNSKKLPLWKELVKSDDPTELEKKLHEEKLLTFDRVFFHEPVGYHLMKSFLISEHSVDKAVFLADVQVFKTLQDPSAREKVSKKIFERFCAPEDSGDIWGHNTTRPKGVSVFEHQESIDKSAEEEDKKHDPEGDDAGGDNNDLQSYKWSLMTENTNSIGVYGRPIARLQKRLEQSEIVPSNVFNTVAADVINDLRLDVFPRFVRSKWYKMYLRCIQYIEDKSEQVTGRDFHQMRMLGRGAFGCVNACKKKDTGKLYAMKQISKKRVMATDSVEAIMSERNFLADVGKGSTDCRFVTSLKYAFMDESTLFLILDLMIGGDLKYHLNHERTFDEKRSKFYAAQVLLGLEHIHSNGIVYRDLKLENVLMDDKGNIKLSDLGLAVRMRDEEGNPKQVRGYAGTPGYTAPEVVLGHYYEHCVDFFSLGVMIYRFLCGKKPFQSPRRHRQNNAQRNQRNQTAELDRNVVEMEPPFPPEYFTSSARSLIKGLLCKSSDNRLGTNGIHEIKQHAWFESVDFGLLEAGYLSPPFIPPLDEIHAEQQQHIGRPPQDEVYAKTKITPEFEKSLQEFPYVNRRVLQEEIVEVLKKVNAHERKFGAHHNKGDTFTEIDAFNSLEQDRDGQSCMAGCQLM